ncbi:MAG: hypothetical protein KJN67_03770 [Pontiella sp.]|nr:hypothetical protein [Pontiella sp.]MBT8046266.1 hypothetical protein [Pontiella sp.]NNJ71385.1 hypothetical protein [Kiritimatiellales bacterium]
MKHLSAFFCFIAAASIALLCGCATTDEFHDDQEYSSMPWNTPQQWEGSRQLPGLTPGY